MSDNSTGAAGNAPGRPIVLAPHDRAWAARFAAEADLLREALGDALVDVHHIGSTAIPGIAAKPVIDILAVVRDLDALDARSHAVVALGYEALGEFGIAGRRYFRKDDAAGIRTHQIHAFAEGSSHVARHVAFRDYLRAHPDAAAEYERLKQALAVECGGDMRRYTELKTAFIQRIERRALGPTD